MARSTTRAEEHSPIGDPEHVAYGADYFWSCTCGASAHTFTDESSAHHRADAHERYCDGTATVKVSL